MTLYVLSDIHWDFCKNDLQKIRALENEKLQSVLAENPDVVITHFCPLPLQEKMPTQFRHDDFSTYFYFNRSIAKDFTNKGKIWCAGHTHTASKENGIIVATLFGSGVLWGILIDIIGITL